MNFSSSSVQAHSVTAAPSLGSQPSLSHSQVSCTSTSSPTISRSCRSAGTRGTPSAPQVCARSFPSQAVSRQHSPHPPQAHPGGHRDTPAPGSEHPVQGQWPLWDHGAAGLVGCTAPCHENRNPAPKIPPGDDEKGNKRPLLRRDWSSTWQGDRPGTPWNKRRSFEAPAQTQGRFPTALQGPKPTAGLC